MISITYILLIGLGIIIIIVVLLAVFKLYKPYTPPTVDTTIFNNQYQINSPWSSSTPVFGIDGQCNVYTFISNNKYAPANISFSNINSCSSSGCLSGTCGCSNPLSNQTCVDDDQVFAIKQTHSCMGDPDLSVRTSGQCIKQNGNLVNKNEVEIYYARCTPKVQSSDITSTSASQTTDSDTNNTRCPGSLSLLAFNVNQSIIGPDIFKNALCMSTPNYTQSTNSYGKVIYSNLTPLKQTVCDMTLSYNGYPSELFRIERSDWDGRKFNSNQNGRFAKITHRPTGFSVSPTFQSNGITPITKGNLQLIDTSLASSTNISSSTGYWWLLVDGLSNGNLVSESQIIYVADPTKVPNPITWEFATSSLSIQPQYDPSTLTLVNNGNVIMDNYFIVDITKTINGVDSKTLAMGLSTSYLDYSILPIIMQNPSNFTF
jgi:hypothetical protein